MECKREHWNVPLPLLRRARLLRLPNILLPRLLPLLLPGCRVARLHLLRITELHVWPKLRERLRPQLYRVQLKSSEDKPA